MKLVRVTKLPEDFPFKIHTLYCWHYKNKYPGLLVKMAGSLCVDMDRLEEIISVKDQAKAA